MIVLDVLFGVVGLFFGLVGGGLWAAWRTNVWLENECHSHGPDYVAQNRFGRLWKSVLPLPILLCIVVAVGLIVYGVLGLGMSLVYVINDEAESPASVAWIGLSVGLLAGCIIGQRGAIKKSHKGKHLSN